MFRPGSPPPRGAACVVLVPVAQLFSACLAAFAHGSNDTSHAAGPFSAIFDLWSKARLRATLTFVALSLLRPLQNVLLYQLSPTLDLPRGVQGLNFCSNSSTAVWVLVVMGFAIGLGYHGLGYKVGIPAAPLRCCFYSAAALPSPNLSTYLSLFSPLR